ncbi:hypothetical protein LZQ00_10325 [Sphingobacterium sp. SRCM116780]|uniref:hypothetical protein n=1 Tax=Sphingobacterium sp. SRCM116780 TaxID=2907623 RepID=UPI001F1AE088|nr:hypothetical protein [Sphingobacterium sp. SRCM116780]UIR54671.1 hypothetical protein LZQ00_10325 [Sphingobacterium sp. SRCM116780]
MKNIIVLFIILLTGFASKGQERKLSIGDNVIVKSNYRVNKQGANSFYVQNITDSDIPKHDVHRNAINEVVLSNKNAIIDIFRSSLNKKIKRATRKGKIVVSLYVDSFGDVISISYSLNKLSLLSLEEINSVNKRLQYKNLFQVSKAFKGMVI